MSMMYTVVAPMLNPFIYSLRNRDMKGALRRVFCIIFKITKYEKKQENVTHQEKNQSLETDRNGTDDVTISQGIFKKLL